MFRGEKNLMKYVYDFDVDGGAASEIVLASKDGFNLLPNGAIVTDVFLKVVTACTSAGSATVDVGDSDDTNGYMESIAVATLADNAVIRAGEYAGAKIWDDTNDHKLARLCDSATERAFSITIGTAALTAGKILFYVEYLVPGED